jgi:DNA-binding NarL/FixJ family response regulator
MPSATAGSEERHTFKTLLVEDSVNLRQLLKEMLHEHFPLMIIEGAGDGNEAAEKVESLSPDLIFMDIKLPGESGLELTKKIKKDHPNIIIIILTSYDLPEYREAAVSYGADAFLTKDSTTEAKIVTLVESYFEGTPS